MKEVKVKKADDLIVIDWESPYEIGEINTVVNEIILRKVKYIEGE